MFKKRVIVALVSTVVFSLILAYLSYTPVSERLPNTSYGSFFSPFPFLILILGAPYILGGIPISIFIDKYVDKNIVKLPLYLIGGYIVGIITMILSFGSVAPELLVYGLFGVVGSLIFWILMSLNTRFSIIKQRCY